MITVFPMPLGLLCACLLSQGIEDGHRSVSFVRTYDACRPGEMVRRFVLENEHWRFQRDVPVRAREFDSAAWEER